MSENKKLKPCPSCGSRKIRAEVAPAADAGYERVIVKCDCGNRRRTYVRRRQVS